MPSRMILTVLFAAILFTGTPFAFGASLRETRKAAEKGDPSAQYEMGYRYETGDGVPKDIAEAIRWYKRAGAFRANGPWMGRDSSAARVRLRNIHSQALTLFQKGEEFHRKNDYPQMLKMFEQAAEMDSAQAILALGKCHCKGIGVPRNPEKAVEYFLRIAPEHKLISMYSAQIEAQWQLGVIYYNGEIGGRRDREKAVHWWTLAADNHTYAKAWLGVCHFNGLGTPKDVAKAVALWQEGANREALPMAKYHLGMCYYKGIGVPQDYRTAYQLFWSALGDMDAEYMCGVCNERGHGTSVSLRDAVRYYTQAAQDGHAKAQARLGRFYFEGVGGVRRDAMLAVRWWREAAKNDVPDALYGLGQCHERGFGLPKDLKKAAEFYRKASEEGSDEAKAALARLENPTSVKAESPAKLYDRGRKYQAGDGVTANDIEALRCFRDAAELGYAPAQCALAWCLLQGKGTARDASEAFAWFEKAAGQHHHPGEFALGQCYAKGWGVPRDGDKAVELWERASAQGNVDADEELARAYEQGLSWGRGRLRPDPAKAVEFWRKAAEKGSLDAICRLADFHEKGFPRHGRRIIEPDAAKARELFQQAAEKDSADAQFRLGDGYRTGALGLAQDFDEAVKWLRLAYRNPNASRQVKNNAASALRRMQVKP